MLLIEMNSLGVDPCTRKGHKPQLESVYQVVMSQPVS